MNYTISINKNIIKAILSYYKYLFFKFINKYFSLYNIEIIELLANNRYEICKKCKLHTFLEKDLELNGLRDNSYICDSSKEENNIYGCGCTLYNKNKNIPQKIYSVTNSVTSTCPLNKWKDIDNLFIEIDNNNHIINKNEVEKIGIISYADKYNLKIKIKC